MIYHEHEIVRATLDYRIEIKLDNNRIFYLIGINTDKKTVEKIIRLLTKEQTNERNRKATSERKY